MTEAQKHILDHCLDAARSLPGMSEEESWRLFRSKLATRRSWLARLTWPWVLGLLVGLGALGVATMRPTAIFGPAATGAASTDRGAHTEVPSRSLPRHNVSAPATEAKAGRRDARGAGELAPSRGHVRRPTGGAKGGTIPSDPSRPLDGGAGSRTRGSTVALGPMLADSDSSQSFNAFAEPFWQTRLTSFRAALDAALDQADRDTIDRMRMRYEWMGQELSPSRAGSATIDSAAMRTDLWGMYVAIGAIAAKHPLFADGYRDSVMAWMDGFFSGLADEARTRRATVAEASDEATDLDSTIVQAERARAATAALATQDEQLRQMYGIGGLPTLALYHGEELESVLEKFYTTMSVFGMHSDPRDLPALDALPTRTVLAAATADPAAERVVVELDLPEPVSDIVVRLVERSGRTARSISAGPHPAGPAVVTLESARLAEGTYLCNVALKGTNGPSSFSTLVTYGRP